MEWYYRKKHIEYKILPAFRSDCVDDSAVSMDFIYPKENSKLYLTKDFEGKTQSVVLKVAHSHSDRGVQYTSKKFRNLLNNHTKLQSISRKGNCWYNVKRKHSYLGNKSPLEFEIMYRINKKIAA